MKQYLTFIHIALCFSIFSFAQTPETVTIVQTKIDSIKQLLNSHNKADEEKVRLLNEYARASFYEMNFMDGLKATHKAHELSKDIDFEGGMVMYYETLSMFVGYGAMADYYQKQAEWLSLQPEKNLEKYYLELPNAPYNFEGALENWLNQFSEAYTYFETLDAKEIQATILSWIMYFYVRQNNFEEALQTSQKGIELAEELNQPYLVFLFMSRKMNHLNDLGRQEEVSRIEADLVEFIAKNKDANTIGLITSTMAFGYRLSGRHALAIEYHSQAIEKFEQSNDTMMLAHSYNRIAFAYAHLEMFDKSVEMHEKSIAIREHKNDKEALINDYNSAVFPYFYIKNYSKAREYMKLAMETTDEQRLIYLKARQNSLEGQILMDQEQYAEAIPIIQSALDTYLEHNRFQSMPFAYMFLARCYYNLENYPEALKNALLSFKIENENNRHRIRVKHEITLLIAEIYNKMGDQGNAYRYMKIHHDFRDANDKLDAANRLADAKVLSIIEKSQNRIDAIEKEREQSIQRNRIQRLWLFSIAGGLLSALFLALILYRNNKSKQKANKLLQAQKEEIQDTLKKLEATQTQLIQSEKMASLGELTAGIAHEIQNPLNFVNNFSEVSNELIDEMHEEIQKEHYDEVKAIASDLRMNLEKINHHGKRADAIVKGMLQHSRSSSETKEPTDINKLADEYFRLAYHGLRAKDKSFNATMEADYDESIGEVKIFAQDIGRVILNLLTNAFYTVHKKKTSSPDNYTPTVILKTKKGKEYVELQITDNGSGIPKDVVSKIFQPFFTTKSTGEGTGLGLSLSYDIAKTHGGDLKVDTTEGKGSTFTLVLPIE
ncbi:ATP-binding protein [Seonamhaeicola aphaedonensis]|uniref:histidine kinase n=1 Tax=Seonamhaeicola aphaedonensis TaxID=1461338 RepID=A0A3D9H633_9FLAO|nr:ATP-binding protein [Seonamhaeicola aphaedonensis]RED44965.1 tetratricopeptide repeat protein [Seonamhaeicola aphaedonensis]